MNLPRRVIIVRRDAPGTFQRVVDSLDHWPEGTVAMVDRRRSDRRVLSQRVTVERRTRQRRVEPDAMWYTHQFIVVEMDQVPTEAVGGQ